MQSKDADKLNYVDVKQQSSVLQNEAKLVVQHWLLVLHKIGLSKTLCQSLVSLDSEASVFLAIRRFCMYTHAVAPMLGLKQAGQVCGLIYALLTLQQGCYELRCIHRPIDTVQH